MADTIQLTEPVTVTLAPHQIQAIVQGLNELPYKYAHPIIEHILQACKEHAAKKAEACSAT